MNSKFIYIRFYKPYQVLSQFTSEPGQRNLSEFGFPKSVYSIGRLDYDSEGLLLLTNDGKFKHRLIEPEFQHSRVYLVQVEKVPSEKSLALLSSGIKLKDFTTRPCHAELMAEAPEVPPRVPPIRYRKAIPDAWLRLTLQEGKNRQVRKMTAAIGHPALRLIRESVAGWNLKGLSPGEWDYIPRSSIEKFFKKKLF